jgi:recombinational DNA repair protein RecR
MKERCPDCRCLTSSAPDPCPECSDERRRSVDLTTVELMLRNRRAAKEKETPCA